MVTPFKTWQGPFNIRAEGLEAKTSQKSMFLSEWGQRLKTTPADLGNENIKKLGVYQIPMLEVEPLNSDWVRHNRERRYIQERPGFSQVRRKKKQNKTHFSGFPTGGIGKKGKTLTFLLWKLDLWNRFCGFVRSHNEFPHSAAARGLRELHGKKITFPSFIFYWKEALDELNSHGLQE